MQLILDCFKRIFEALSGIYTKAETDAQLAERDSRIANAEENIGLNAEAVEQLDTALEAEATARQEADAALTESDKKQDEFNHALSVATADYAKNPTVDVSWTSSNPPALKSKDECVVNFKVKEVRNGALPEDFYGDLFVPNATLFSVFKGNVALKRVRLSFSGRVNVATAFMESNVEDVQICAIGFSETQSIFNAAQKLRRVRIVLDDGKLPNNKYFFYGANNLSDVVLYVSKADNIMFYGSGAWTKSISRLVFVRGLELATIIRLSSTNSAGRNTKLTHIDTDEYASSNAPITFPSCLDLSGSFRLFSVFNQVVLVPSLHTGDDAFLNAGMSAENISAVLDSLPSDPVSAGGTGVITFTGCPGAAELTQESASVAAATARGWTVEL